MGGKTNRTGPFSFGVEEEFFLAERSTAQIVRCAPEGFLADCHRRMGDRVGHEMLQSQVETRTVVCLETAELEAELLKLRRSLIESGERHGIAIVSAGTFPMAEWREQTHTDEPRYQSLVDDFQIIGRRNLLCGLHVHVAPPPGVDRIDVMNRLLPWLPLFLALSASSPFWNRGRTGLMSYRQAAYDEWPRTGIPDYFRDEPDFQEFVAAMVQAGVIADAGYLWWAVRPSSRFPTIELRICDACTRVGLATGIACLFRCLVRLLVRRPEFGRERSSMTRMLIEENRWQAKRHGMRAEFVDALASNGRKPVAASLGELLELCADDARHFGCERQVAALAAIPEDGNSAEGQLAVYRAARDQGADTDEGCRRVVDWLIEETSVL
ncbi:MAG: carboxylate-amine ligase [Steroidobacteraceae bacterium]